jgi:sugar lactone lactonase YvrE
MYPADTPRKTIWALDYDPETDHAENHRVFAEVGGDGDRDGFYIWAVFGARRLLQWDPGGKLGRPIPEPPLYPAMPALDGDDLSALYVTSASFAIPSSERATHPDAGAPFAEVLAPGLPESLFRPPQRASSS